MTTDSHPEKKFTLSATFLIVRHGNEYFVINRSHNYGKKPALQTNGRHSETAVQLMISVFQSNKAG
ncbi:hypothetical protein AB6864_22530 [Serratia proteamaculans]|uniref:hypothetical protein n=1 Tax=Serratia proteamaculans TaxID=28151 RepID=UPI0021BDAD40|nr:hypothetical protein [Serratia proteamaculans]